MLHVYTLFSGSGGNCVFVQYGNNCILVDAGGSAKKIVTALAEIGHKPEEIDAIFITHGHSDHVSALRVLTKRMRVPVYLTDGAGKYVCVEDPACLHIQKPIFEVKIGEITVSSFATPHDSDMSVGYVLTTPEGRVGIATDIGYVSPDVQSALMGCEYVMLEANHDEEMLRYGEYPPMLKRRIFSMLGHLSNAQCACFARELVENGTKELLLAHLSKENNTPELALQTVADALRGTNCHLQVASRSDPTALLA